MIRPFNRHVLMAPAGETSASNAPEVQSNSDIYQSADPLETFDDLEYESPASKKIGEEYASKNKSKIANAKALKKDNEEEEKEEKPKKKEEKKTELDTLSDKSEDEDEKEKTPKKEEKKKVEDSKTVETPEETEKKLEADQKGKIKVRMNGELYGLEQDAVVRYKVDGEWVERPLQEALNKASGVEALDKKFTEFGNQKKEFETERAQVTKTKEVLSKTVVEIVDILKDPNKNPQDALQILVERSGQDPYTLWKRNLESALDEVEKLQSMNEAERKAYFLEKKDEFRTKADDARTKYAQEAEANHQAILKADSLRQAHGVSEEQFMEAWDELEAQGTKNPSNEQIVEYASIKPHVTSVQDILEPFEAEIDDTKYSKVVTDFARQLRAKEITPEQLKEIAAAEFMDKDLKDLTIRKKTAEKKEKEDKVVEPTGKHTYESFDDLM